MKLQDLYITALDWHDKDYVEIYETTLAGKKNILYRGHTPDIPQSLTTNTVTYWFVDISLSFTEPEPTYLKTWHINLEAMEVK